VVIAYRVTRPDAVILRCTLSTLAEEMAAAKIHLTALILIGPMLEPDRVRNSHLYDSAFSHRFRRGQRSS
jgi:precorrin-4/cobalt-precorrin-4 C11-methyltransferase